MTMLELDKPVDELTNEEIRGRIARKTGHRPPRNNLNKKILNSVHAWFHGDFYVKPARLKPGVPPKSELVAAVVIAAQNELYDPDDDGDATDGPLGDYEADLNTTDGPPRAMNKDELKALFRAMESREDQRHWTP